MMGIVDMRDANRSPRRWVDESGRVRVIEGWHPSQPSQLGYNLKLDDEWLGTFGTLDGAANAAAAHVRLTGLHIEYGQVPLTVVADPGEPCGEVFDTGRDSVADAPMDEPEA